MAWNWYWSFNKCAVILNFPQNIQINPIWDIEGMIHYMQWQSMKYSTNSHILHATKFSFFGQFYFLECFGIFEWCNSNCCTLRIGRCGARMKARNIIRGRQKHVFVPKWLDGNEGQCLQTVWQKWETSIVANYNCYLELLLLFLLCLVWEHRRGGGKRPRL